MGGANTDESLVACVRLLTWKHKVLTCGYMFPILHFNAKNKKQNKKIPIRQSFIQKGK